MVKVMEHHGMPAADVMAKMVAAQGGEYMQPPRREKRRTE